MKRKMKGVLGVILTLVLLVSLTAGLAAPAAADPDELEWSKMAFPKTGANGDWFRSEAITAVGPIAMAIDGSLFAFVDGENILVKSEDGGRTWTKTKYAGDDIVAIAPSSIDADIVYVAEDDAIWKSTNVFSSTKWSKLAEDSLTTTVVGNITCLDVGYKDDAPFVFIGSENGASYNGDVYYLNEAAYGSSWADLDVDIDGTEGWNVYAVAVDPDFDTSSQVIAVVTDATETYVTNNSGTPGTWFGDVELWPGNDDTADIAITGASAICFPSDFDSSEAYELFVGVSDGSDGGDVYRVLATIAYDLSAAGTGNVDIASLDLVGPIGSTALLAGDLDDAQAYHSTDDGSTWAKTKKAPTGDGPTYVLVADDFDDSGEAWAATTSTGTEGGTFSFTTDTGVLWNGISLIDTDDTYTVDDIAFGSDRFMVTDGTAGPTNNDVWKYDGEYWERVECLADVDLVQTSPEYASDSAVFIADSSTANIWRSSDGGGRFIALSTEPGSAISAWLVIDSLTLISCDGSDIWKTTDRGRTPWKDKGDGNLVSFALSPDYADDETIIAGNNAGVTYRSTNAGDLWKAVGTSVLTGDTYVAFDPGYADNETLYAAGDDEVARYNGTKWEEILTTSSIASFDTASGLVCSADGTLYATDDSGFAGMGRTLAPTASTEAYCEWENVTKGATTANLSKLHLTYGSNVLWGISGAYVYTYEDTLALPVVLTSPADGASSGRENTCSVGWEALDGAKKYEVRCNTRSDFKGVEIDVEDVKVAATGISGLSSGRTYYWKVRVAAGKPVYSRWSEVWSFTTAMGEGEWNPFKGAVTEYPVGATDVPLRPAFVWNAADWATGYEFELSASAGTTARGYFVDVLIGMTGANALVNTVWQCDRDLDYSTTYYWHVKAISATSDSEWATGVFTTMAKPVVPPAPTPPVEIPPAPAPITPAWIWAIVVIGAVLVIAVIVLIVTTRRVP